jgi:hypothetical protein
MFFWEHPEIMGKCLQRPLPFNMMSIGPQTYPHIHAGYEYLAKRVLVHA